MSSNKQCGCCYCTATRNRELIEFAKADAPLVLLDEGNTSDAVISTSGGGGPQCGSGCAHSESEYCANCAAPLVLDHPEWRLSGAHTATDKAFREFSYQLCAKITAHSRPESLNDFAAECHALNQTWWHDPATGAKLDLNMGELLMLVVSELSECMEGERKDLMDDHLPHRKMAEVELADAVLRLSDIAGSREVDLDREFIPRTGEPDPNKAAALFSIVDTLVRIESDSDITWIGYALGEIEAYAVKHGYDLWGAVYEKREYNAHRADHKPAARLATNGKKF